MGHIHFARLNTFRLLRRPPSVATAMLLDLIPIHYSHRIIFLTHTTLFASQFKCYGEQDHDVDFPHLLHSMNATQVDIEFFKLARKGIEKVRIAAEIILIASELDQEKSFVVSTRKTLDDEHTPGIFELIDITSPESYTAARGLFFFKYFRFAGFMNR